MIKEWLIKQPNPVLIAQISKQLSVSPISAQILVNNGIGSVSEAHSFLNPSIDNLHDPFQMKDMRLAVNRVIRALHDKEKICLYGDYDVDGLSSTAILYRFLKLLNADIMVYVPDRINEGYSFNKPAIESIIEKGAQVLISVDCGITSIEEVEICKAKKVDVIITDHHESGSILPKALAVINPKMSDCPYPFQELSGTGVAMKLAWAIAEEIGPAIKKRDDFKEFIKESLAFAALGTVADIVPLVDENRILVYYGLKAMTETTNPGIRALMDTNTISDSVVTTEDIAFRIAPRINAAGRLGKTDLAVRLFLTDSLEEAYDIASELEKTNRKRQQIERVILNEANQQIDPEKVENTIVLAGDEWHRGVIGIVASRIAEKYFRPTVIISLSDNMGRGSARSISGFHLYDVLTQCSGLLAKFGGHAAAAGLSIEKENIELFRKTFEAEASRILKPEELRPKLTIDAEVHLQMVSIDLYKEIDRIAPFGNRNLKPILMCRNLKIIGNPRLVGANGNHVQFKVISNGKVRRVIGFNMGSRIEEINSYRNNCDIGFNLSYNEWDGYPNVDLVLKEIRKGF